jgi:excisionase family DNA binding protein
MTVCTAAALARFCGVDLKTIHNWAARGALPSHRTAGRHLRFHRLDAIAFLRAYGHAIPAELAAARPKLAMACRDAHVVASARRALGARATVLGYDDAFEALVDLARAEPEALAVDVALLGALAVRCVARLTSYPATRHVRIVALAETDGGASELLAAGADTFVAGFDAVAIAVALERVLAVDER